MTNSTVVTKVASLLFLSMLVATLTLQAQAMTCGEVVQTMLPCLSYLQKGGQVPSVCCDAARSLNNSARMKPDRQIACSCLKQAAKSFSINYGYAEQLASKCGLDIGIVISPSIDCSKVH